MSYLEQIKKTTAYNKERQFVKAILEVKEMIDKSAGWGMNEHIVHIHSINWSLQISGKSMDDVAKHFAKLGFTVEIFNNNAIADSLKISW